MSGFEADPRLYRRSQQTGLPSCLAGGLTPLEVHMHRLLLAPSFALAGALTLGCADQQSPTGLDTDPLAPSLRAERVPVFSPVLLGGDPSNPFAVQAGYEAGLTAEDVCPDTGEHVDPNSQGQAILTPRGGVHISVSARDVSLVVYEFGEGIVTDVCQLVGAPVVGTGSGKYSTQLVVSGPGATVLHITVQGIIDLVRGGQARVLATAQVTILPDGTLLIDKERVRLTPL